MLILTVGRIGDIKLLTAFGMMVDQRLIELKLSYKYLAHEMRIDEGNLSNLIHGRRGVVSGEILAKLMSILKLTPGELKELAYAAKLSRKKITIPNSVAPDTVTLINLLTLKADFLPPTFADLMIAMVSELAESGKTYPVSKRKKYMKEERVTLFF